ncbi:MAG: MFS transporter [Nitrospirales bacterium]
MFPFARVAEKGLALIFRFSLYGFLKNLRLFEPFLILALLERGLDFFAIGGLIAVREITLNVLEVPSGAVADSFGRKRCLVFSMTAYMAAYLILGLAHDWWMMAVGMLIFGAGDAFRSGTHKAFIYAWLRREGRTQERTRVYGYTRSYSQLGSACSAFLAGGIIVWGFDYSSVFLISAVPAFVNLLNVATYPGTLDSTRLSGIGAAWLAAWRHLGQAMKTVIRQGPLRRLVVESLTVEGGYKVGKDYIQPVLQTLAMGLPMAIGLNGQQRTGLIVGVVSTCLFLATSVASRQAHRLEAFYTDTEPAARFLVHVHLVLYVLLGAALALGWVWLTVFGFIGLAIAKNMWRPIHVGRFDRDGQESHAATTLSLEAQGKGLAAALWAPLIGALVDRFSSGVQPVPLTALWPVSLLALPILLLTIEPIVRHIQQRWQATERPIPPPPSLDI